MAKQLIRWLLRRRLTKLTGIFSAISMQKLADSCGFSSIAEAEAEIVFLMKHGYINARIESRSAVVRFSEKSFASNAEVVGLITDRLRESMELSDALRAWQMRLYSSKAFISRQVPRTHGEGSIQVLPGEDYDPEFA